MGTIRNTLAGFLVPAMLLTLVTADALAADAAKTSDKDASKSAAASEMVAKIGSATISRVDLNKTVASISAQNRLPENLPPEQQKQLDNMALDQLIDLEVVFQEALKTPFPDIDKRLELKLKQNRERFTSPAQYESALMEAGLNDKALTEIVRKDIIVTNYIEREISSKIIVTESDAKKFYDDNIASFTKNAQIRASHILIGVEENSSAETRQKAKNKTDALLKEIKEGANFAKLAQNNSTCPTSKQGGDLGYLITGQTVPQFEKAAFALKPGEISEVVETQFGYHIIKLVEKKDSEVVPFSEAKANIIDYIKNQKVQQELNQKISELKGKITIERYLK